MRSYESETGSAQRGATTTAIAVLLTITMTMSLSYALITADRSLFISQGYVQKTTALLLAEAAVEDAMDHLDTIEDWSTITLPQEEYTAPYTVGDGIAWSSIKNDLNDPSDTDSNGFILIKGYGQTLSNQYTENVEVLYWRPTLSIPPIAGLNICGEDVLTSNNGNLLVSGLNHELPPSPCSGSHCNAEESDDPPDVTGIAFELFGQESVAEIPRNVEGTPDLASGVCMLQGANGLCSKLRSLMSYVDRLVGIEILTDWPVNGHDSYGTVEAPRFILVPEGQTLMLNGTTQGAGVLFVKGTLDIRGTFTWSGIIIIGGGGLLDIRGTANIFGSVATAGTDGNPAGVSMRGNGSISWADKASFVGPTNFPGMMNSWREFRR